MDIATRLKMQKHVLYCIKTYGRAQWSPYYSKYLTAHIHYLPAITPQDIESYIEDEVVWTDYSPAGYFVIHLVVNSSKELTLRTIAQLPGVTQVYESVT